MPSHWTTISVFVFLVITLWLLLPNHAPGTSVRPKQPTRFHRRIVAVGDLHGDLNNALDVLQMSNLIDENEEWVGGTDILVQTGDIVDR